MPASSEVAGHRPVLRVVLGRSAAEAGGGGECEVALPVLGDEMTREEIFGETAAAVGAEGVALYEGGDGLLLGRVRATFADRDIAEETRALYERVLAACAGRHLYRLWNYVPAINAERDGLENYRAFCKGRSVAFEAALGGDFRRDLPAASAVGSDGGALEVIFAAGRERPSHVENPTQVPAYEYPADYGPRSPSFSRATIATVGARRFVFVSGTAAIKGHVSLGAGSLADQVACTLDNLRQVGRATGVGEDLGADGGWTRHFKIYLRRAEDFAAARAMLTETGALLRPEDRAIWLRSDICRAELAIEIEVTLQRV